MQHYWAVVPAAGVGKRMKANKPKQYLALKDKTVLEHTLDCLISSDLFEKISIAITETDPYWPELAISKHDKIVTAAGGKERADSVLSALTALEHHAQADDWVFVHDAARPCITIADMILLLETLKNDPVGGILALPSHDTLKQVNQFDIEKTIDRSIVWKALTPQMFRFGLLKSALEKSIGNKTVTDEASALELENQTVKVVEGRSDNIKITRPEDLALAEFYMDNQS